MSGINDFRVATWEPTTLTARLQAAICSGRPILFRLDYDGGHGLANSKDSTRKRQQMSIASSSGK
jgi:prolyl oligopeptidase